MVYDRNLPPLHNWGELADRLIDEIRWYEQQNRNYDTDPQFRNKIAIMLDDHMSDYIDDIIVEAERRGYSSGLADGDSASKEHSE